MDHPSAPAIVGLGCRFPGGAETPQAFWRLLCGTTDALRALPADRAARQRAPLPGGFLDGVDGFDAPFFGVSASEARCMDPQQRLLLEVCWEAMEDAGLAPDTLAGRRVGVFVGAFTNDYELLQARAGGALGPYYGTGTSAALLAGRVAYRFGFTGPALVVNTACSSSLVALHLARRSLAAGECELALVAGVNLILSDEITTSFQAAGMLAADGRCKPWDAQADGYVRSEGCAALLLEPEASARARGARVHALAAGSAVNQDGASGGITAPSAAAQRQLIDDALRDARCTPDAVQYVEAHATGTPVGDPIECEALAAVFGTGGRAAPLRLGSVKGHIGHTEAAAGLAGVIKTVLAMQQGELPPTLHHRQPRPGLALERVPAQVVRARTPWPADADGRRCAGVNSFGFSGTNAHVILVQPVAAPEVPVPARPQLLCLSASVESALTDLAARHEQALNAHGDDALAAMCRTAGGGRQHFRHRLAVCAATPAAAAQALAAWRAGRTGPACSGRAGTRPPRVAWLFTGQGAQHAGMGRGLYETDERFRAAIDHCDALLAPRLGRSLAALMFGMDDDAEAVLAQTRFTQPAMFAYQVALASMFTGWGIAPAAVLGHSVGEFAAAVVAGVLPLDDALTLVEARGRLMQVLPGGAMTAVQAGAEALAPLLAQHDGALWLSALNAPQASVLGGSVQAMASAHAWLQQQGLGHVPLEVSHAFHTPQMQPMQAAWREALAAAPLAPPTLPYFSTVTGALEMQAPATPDYWCNQVTAPVRYARAVQCLAEAGFDACLELGPSPVLVNLARLGGAGATGLWLAGQQAGRPDRDTALQAAAQLYVRGVALCHDAMAGAPRPGLTALPTYPFQRKPYWFEPARPPAPPIEGPPMNAPATPANAQGVLTDYYRDLSARVQQAPAGRPFIRFAPFAAPLAGFTWLPTFLGRPLPAAQQAQVDAAHAEMRGVLFEGIDAAAVRRVLDIGCGYATDLVELAQSHAHWVLDGCNLSAEQVDFGRRAVARAGLEGRITLHHRDSARDEFPGLYDLAISHQVIHHIRDKDAVLRNVAEHLRRGGLLVAAEIVSLLDEPIDHAPSSAHFETRQAWARLLADHRLRLLRCVDASGEIANYLHDDDFEATLRAQALSADASTVAHLGGPHALGLLLRRGLAGYLLLRVQRDPLASPEALHAENLERLLQPLPYAQARRPARAPAMRAVASAPVAAAAPVDTVPPPELAAPAAPVAGAPHEGVARIVASLLECSTDALDSELPLVAQGLNSILAMDLTRRLKASYGLAVSVKALLNGATVASLARDAGAVPVPARGAPGVPAAPELAALAARLDTLGEADIDRLLAQLEPRRETA